MANVNQINQDVAVLNIRQKKTITSGFVVLMSVDKITPGDVSKTQYFKKSYFIHKFPLCVAAASCSLSFSSSSFLITELTPIAELTPSTGLIQMT